MLTILWEAWGSGLFAPGKAWGGRMRGVEIFSLGSTPLGKDTLNLGESNNSVGCFLRSGVRVPVLFHRLNLAEALG